MTADRDDWDDLGGWDDRDDSDAELLG